MMIRSFLFFLCCTGFVLLAYSQDTIGITHSGQKTGQPPFPVDNYTELPNPIPVDTALWKGEKSLQVSWGSIDDRYKKEEPVALNKKIIALKGWRGEQVAAQWILSNYRPSVALSYKIGDLIKNDDPGQKIKSEDIFSGFVRYVLTDELNKDKKGACGYRDNADYDSLLVADPIDHLATSLTVEQYDSRAVWMRIGIPSSALSGDYTGRVEVLADGKKVDELKVKLHVNKRVLPAPSDWSFHLDLWQNPFAVARYYGVRPWSEEHFEKLRQDLRHYAEAGGKVITASITHRPWDGQTYDGFETMITWMKRADGSWYYDYTIFDRWVQFMMDLGVDKQINLYSMIPWKLSFQYYDQATNQLRFLEAEPGEKEYGEFWGNMLSALAAHLKEKGWFEKTYIAMDERSMEAMKETLKVIHQADPGFNVALAGDLHREIVNEIDDYCLTLGQDFSAEELQRRKKEGKFSTFYTSCAHPYPNSFTFSPPAESEWIGWHAAALGLDGFLRWAYNSWVLEPLLDSRFTTWAAGDTYFVYPGGRTSIRFERLVAGIQQYEKIRIIKSELKKQGDEEGLQKLAGILKGFEKLNPQEQSAASRIKEARKSLEPFFEG